MSRVLARRAGAVWLLLAVLVLAAVVVAVWPPGARANHHACPQITVAGGDVNVARKDCSPVYAPYPVGGPKSPLPSGANVPLPPVVPGCVPGGKVPVGVHISSAKLPPNGAIAGHRCPPGSLIDVPTVTNPYPPFKPLPGQGSPYDPLGCYGPDLSGPTKSFLQPILGQPRGSDPADPYNCSGGWIMSRSLAMALLAVAPTGGGTTSTPTGTTPTMTVTTTTTVSAPPVTVPTTVTVPPVTVTLPGVTTVTVTVPPLSKR